MKKSKLIAGVAVIASAVSAGLLWQNGDTSADDIASTDILDQPPRLLMQKRWRAVAMCPSPATVLPVTPCQRVNISLAGGYFISTSFGGIRASNITPDSETGIDNWTERDFFRALRHGRGKQGEHLYPAMPYNAYVKLTDQDMRDL